MKDRDIIERLRDSQPEGTTGGYLLNDAADEIKRLREELVKYDLRALTLEAELNEADNENAVLRALLRADE
jgi:hypothetical protein